MSDWYECELIEEIDDFVKKHLTKEDLDQYFDTFSGSSYEDWPSDIGRWLEDKISALQVIQDLVDDLPETLPDQEEGNSKEAEADE